MLLRASSALRAIARPARRPLALCRAASSAMHASQAEQDAVAHEVVNSVFSLLCRHPSSLPARHFGQVRDHPVLEHDVTAPNAGFPSPHQGSAGAAQGYDFANGGSAGTAQEYLAAPRTLMRSC